LDIDVKEIALLYVVLRQVCFGESDRLRNRQNRRANRQKERRAKQTKRKNIKYIDKYVLERERER
jgi:hypothetical protein